MGSTSLTNGATDKTLRVGIAGHGLVGKRRQNFIDLHTHMQTVAVSDIKYEGEGELKPGLNFYKSPYRMVEQEQLDILFVCLTNDIAADVTILGLENDLHVFCEKPPGRTVEDIKRVREVEASRSHLKLKYGFNHRYHDSVLEAIKIVQSNEFGRLINIRGVYGKSLIVTPESDWRSKREIAGGGILLDQGIHMVDLMRLFAGEFHDVHSYVSNDFYGYDVEDNVQALMKSDKGVVAALHSTATEWRHRFRLELGFETGALALEGILSSTKSYGQETLRITFKGQEDKGNPKEQVTSYIHDNSWKQEIEDFAECILEDKKVGVGKSEDALRTMELVYRIYRADGEWSKKYL